MRRIILGGKLLLFFLEVPSTISVCGSCWIRLFVFHLSRETGKSLRAWWNLTKISSADLFSRFTQTSTPSIGTASPLFAYVPEDSKGINIITTLDWIRMFALAINVHSWR